MVKDSEITNISYGEYPCFDSVGPFRFRKHSLIPLNNVDVDIDIFCSKAHRLWDDLEPWPFPALLVLQKVDTEDVSQQPGRYYRRKLHPCPRPSRYVHDQLERLHFIMTEPCYLQRRTGPSEGSSSSRRIS